METNGFDKNGRYRAGASAGSRRQNGIPAQIAWPLFVIGLLVLGVGWSLSVVIASRSDGGAQVIENYYDKAVGWDETVAMRRRSEALGWTVDLQIVGGETPELVIQIRNGNGQPVADLKGYVKTFRPQRAGAIAEMPLTAIPDAPGMYRQPLKEARAGLWDFEITAQRDSAHFYTLIRKELLL